MLRADCPVAHRGEHAFSSCEAGQLVYWAEPGMTDNDKVSHDGGHGDEGFLPLARRLAVEQFAARREILARAVFSRCSGCKRKIVSE